MLKVGRVNFSFAAAHHLPNHDGACKNLHGHNYRLEVEFAGHVDRKTGMIADFKKIKELVNVNIIEFLDHKNLNDIDSGTFPNHNPTAELMVLWMAEVIDIAFAAAQQLLFMPEVKLFRLRLWETDNCYVELERT